LKCLDNTGAEVTISPSVTGSFVNGYWEGYVQIDTPGHYYLTATASDGTYGESINFNVITELAVVSEPPFWLALLGIAAAVALVTICRKRSINK
jgi:hypothetical protein